MTRPTNTTTLLPILLAVYILMPATYLVYLAEPKKKAETIIRPTIESLNDDKKESGNE